MKKFKWYGFQGSAFLQSAFLKSGGPARQKRTTTTEKYYRRNKQYTVPPPSKKLPLLFLQYLLFLLTDINNFSLLQP